MALVRDPLYTYAHYNLASVLYGAGRFADAEFSYRKLLAIAPGFSWTRRYLAKTLLAEGKPKEALAMAQQEVSGWGGRGIPIRHSANRLAGGRSQGPKLMRH